MKMIYRPLAVLLSLLLCGCAASPASVSATTSDAGAASSPQVSQPPEDNLAPLQREQCEALLFQMQADGHLLSTWQGMPPEGMSSGGSTTVEWLGASQENGVITVKVGLTANLFFDPETKEEQLDYGPEPMEALLTFGEAVVQMKEVEGEMRPASCTYTPYDHPALDYLQAETARLAPQLAASTKPDLSGYDKNLVRYVWQLLNSRRYIATPEEITLYDLESYDGSLQLDYGTVITEDVEIVLDASLLKLMPNVIWISSSIPLTDYSVFAAMNSLEKLELHQCPPNLTDTLAVGNTRELFLHDVEGMLDLTGVNAETLRLSSWSKAVTGFVGCEKVKNLYIMSTRTDMRLVNPETFPNAEYMNLYFFSEMARVRDLSRLAEYAPGKVVIDVMLSNQACNAETLESLVGVPVRNLVLDNANNGLPAPDRALLDRLTVETESIILPGIPDPIDSMFQEWVK